MNRSHAALLTDDEPEPTAVLAEGAPHRRRRISRRIWLTSSDNLPIAQFVCAVLTSLACVTYVVQVVARAFFP